MALEATGVIFNEILAMLNVEACDADRIELLEQSYRNIRQRDHLEIVSDQNEWKALLDQTIYSIDAPQKGTFSFKNLFRLTPPGKRFYIAQCMVDYGMQHASGSGPSHYMHEFDLQLIGIAHLKADLGKTIMRPETKIDKVTDWIFNRDIDFIYSDIFNDKYYLVSDNKEKVIMYFDQPFIDTIGKYDGVHLVTKGREMYVYFNEGLTEDQSAIVEDILSNCGFVEDA